MTQLPKKHRQLIKRLTFKTTEGDLEWEETGDEDNFILHLSTGAVVVGKEPSHNAVGSDFSSEYRMTIFGHEDEAIRKTSSVNVGKEERDMLQSLFEAAKYSFFESEETVDVMST